MNDAYIFEALRTPRGVGKPSGALYEVKPVTLLVVVLNELQKRYQLDTSQVDDTIIGCVTPVNDQGANIAKAALLHAGWDQTVPGMQINRFCGSGLEAINLAAMKIRSGWEKMVVAGGVESMSRVPMATDGGALLFDPEVVAAAGNIPQGVAADLLATQEGFSREAVDSYALLSQQRASNAQIQGFFDRSMVAVYDRNNLPVLERDEHLRPDTTMEKLAELPLAFQTTGAYGFNEMALMKYPTVERIHHVHTAGNSSGIVDGAAAVLIGSHEKGKDLGLRPRAKILSTATVSGEPTMMFQGLTTAAEKALSLAGMKPREIDLWEVNEAFAAAVLKFQRDLEINNDQINVNGGAIALGHPLGATGAMLLGTLLDELERGDLNTGLVSLSAAGGMGVACIIERV